MVKVEEFYFDSRDRVTKVHAVMDADTFFPEINQDEWLLAEKSEEQIDENNGLHYSFLTYTKKEK